MIIKYIFFILKILNIIKGDLLNATEEYICQQCNCISVKPHGLSKSIKEKFGVDPYSFRRSLNGRNYAVKEDQSVPGKIQVFNSRMGNKIICMYSQYGMGKPYNYGNKVEDSYELRLKWFYICLYEISLLKPKSLAFPYNIGCGLAGGNWERDYYPAIKYFSEKFPQIKIVLYKL